MTQMKTENFYTDDDAPIGRMVGKTITKIVGKVGDDVMEFHAQSGEVFIFKYEHD